MINGKYPPICYLCGKPLIGDLDDDHVPPKQFYSKSMKMQCNVNLFTIPVHGECNRGYCCDEEYFVNTLAPLAMDTDAGREKFKDIAAQRKRPQGRRLINHIFSEFDPRPSGLYLPNKVIKRFDGDRVRRVIWKITRGLYFREYSEYLPIDAKHAIIIGEPLPDEFAYVRDTPSCGDYLEVFDYKKLRVEKSHLWAMLLWNRIIVLIVIVQDNVPARPTSCE